MTIKESKREAGEAVRSWLQEAGVKFGWHYVTERAVQAYLDTATPRRFVEEFTFKGKLWYRITDGRSKTFAIGKTPAEALFCHGRIVDVAEAAFCR